MQREGEQCELYNELRYLLRLQLITLKIRKNGRVCHKKKKHSVNVLHLLHVGIEFSRCLNSSMNPQFPRKSLSGLIQKETLSKCCHETIWIVWVTARQPRASLYTKSKNQKPLHINIHKKIYSMGSVSRDLRVDRSFYENGNRMSGFLL